MQEGLALEHGREVLSHTLEHHINPNAAANKSHGHLQTFWWDIADAAFDVVRNPQALRFGSHETARWTNLRLSYLGHPQ